MSSLLEQALDVLRAEIAQVQRERDDARRLAILADREVTRLANENGKLCDDLFTAQQRIAELEKGRAA